MAEGTFDKTGSGTSEDPIRADIPHDADTQKIIGYKVLEDLGTQLRVQYEIVQMQDGDDRLFWGRVKNVYDALKAGTATAAQTQKALAALMRHVRRKDGV